MESQHSEHLISQTTPSSEQAGNQPEDSKSSRNRDKLTIIVLSAVGIIAFAIGIYLIFCPKSPSEPEPVWLSHMEQEAEIVWEDQEEDGLEEEYEIDLPTGEEVVDMEDPFSSENTSDNNDLGQRMVEDIFAKAPHLSSNEEVRYFYSGYFSRNGRQDPITVAFVETQEDYGNISQALYKNDTYGTIVRMNATVNKQGISLIGDDNGTRFVIELTDLSDSELTGTSIWGDVEASVSLSPKSKKQ